MKTPETKGIAERRWPGETPVKTKVELFMFVRPESPNGPRKVHLHHAAGDDDATRARVEAIARYLNENKIVEENKITRVAIEIDGAPDNVPGSFASYVVEHERAWAEAVLSAREHDQLINHANVIMQRVETQRMVASYAHSYVAGVLRTAKKKGVKMIKIDALIQRFDAACPNKIDLD